jgi:hypothetical protein
MISVADRLRRRPQPDPTRHLDDAALALLLRGEETGTAHQAAGHLTVCAACRRRMETADPLLALFAEVDEPAAARPFVAMPVAARTRLAPRPHWQLSAGLAFAAAAAVAFTVAHQPGGSSSPLSPQAQALTDVQRVTAKIHTAAERHDLVALRQALVEAKAELTHIDSAHISDAKLVAELGALRHEVASLPHDPETVALVSGVETLIDQAPGETATPEPAPGGGSDATAAPAASPLPTPEATPESTPQPTPEPTPEPSPSAAPAADATPAAMADASPSPEPSPSPDSSPTATPTDKTPPY